MRISHIVFVILCLWSTASLANRDFICKPSTIRAVRAEVTARTQRMEQANHCDRTNDKNMHCAVSCVLTLRCFSTDVLILGLGKEIVDVFTPGDADLRDLKADFRGVDLASSGRARNRADCYRQCDAYYPFTR